MKVFFVKLRISHLNSKFQKFCCSWSRKSLKKSCCVCFREFFCPFTPYSIWGFLFPKKRNLFIFTSVHTWTVWSPCEWRCGVRVFPPRLASFCRSGGIGGCAERALAACAADDFSCWRKSRRSWSKWFEDLFREQTWCVLSKPSHSRSPSRMFGTS